MKKLENLTSDEKTILREINFYYNKELKEAKDLDIKAIKYNNNIVHLLLSYPGVFIGQFGKDIDEFTKILQSRLNNPKLSFHLERSVLNLYLINI